MGEHGEMHANDQDGRHEDEMSHAIQVVNDEIAGSKVQPHCETQPPSQTQSQTVAITTPIPQAVSRDSVAVIASGDEWNQVESEPPSRYHTPGVESRRNGSALFQFDGHHHDDSRMMASSTAVELAQLEKQRESPAHHIIGHEMIDLLPASTHIPAATSPNHQANVTGMDAQEASDNRYLRQSVIVLAVSMFFIFAMYSPVQNVITSVYPELGSYSLSLVYGLFTASCIVAPSVARKIGAHNALIVSSIGYLSYTLSCFTTSTTLVLLASACIGLSAGVIWTSQGAVLTSLSTTENRGTHSSLVIGCVRGAAVVSNFVMGIILSQAKTAGPDVDRREAYSADVLFLVFLLIGSVGLMGFLVLRMRMRKVAIILERRAKREEAEKQKRDIDEPTEQPRITSQTPAGPPPPSSSSVLTPAPVRTSLHQRLVEVFRMMGSTHYRYLFPVFLLLQGCGQGYYFGVFATIMGKDYLGFAQAAMALMAITCISLLGRWLDRIPIHYTYRKKWIPYITLTLHLVVLALATITTYYAAGYSSREELANLPRKISQQRFTVLVYTTSILYGAAYSGTDICMWYMIGQIYPLRSETAFAAKSFNESCGFVVSNLLALAIGVHWYPIVAMCWGVPALLWFARWKMPLEMLHSKRTRPRLMNNPTISSSPMSDQTTRQLQPNGSGMIHSSVDQMTRT